MKTRVLALGLAAVAWTTGASAAELRLQPSGPWAVNYADDSCELVRAFGSGDDQVTLSLLSFEPTAMFGMSLYGKPAVIRTDTTVGFGAEKPEPRHFIEGRVAPDVPGLLMLGGVGIGAPPPKFKDWHERVKWRAAVDDAREQATESIAIGGLRTNVVLETGSLGRPLAALRTCAEELTSHWGIDVERHRTLSHRLEPRTDPATWLRSDDYPEKMLREGLSGAVRFRLTVDEAGKVADCHVQVATQPSDFANVTCRLLQLRASFVPALDAAGKPLRSYYTSSINFLY